MSDHEGITIAITGSDDATLAHYYGRAEDDPDQCLNLHGTALVGDVRYPFTFVHGWDADEWWAEVKFGGDDWSKLDERHQYLLGSTVQDICKGRIESEARAAGYMFSPGRSGDIWATLIGWNR